MELTALSASRFLALLGMAAAAVVVLYLLKLRRRAVRVPFVVLWENLLAERRATQWFSRIKRLFSLLIALLVVAVLATALGDPRPSSALSAATNTVLLVDTGLSMQATDVSPSRLEAARETALKLIESMRPQDQMLVAQMHGVTTPVSPMTSDKHTLKASVIALQAVDVCADFSAAYRFALDVLGSRPHSQIVLISDGAFRQDPELEASLFRPGVNLSFAAVGKRERNLAITAFSARRYPLDKDRSELLLELGNFSARAQTVRLTLLGDQLPIHVERVALGARERLQRVYEDVSAVDRVLEARIDLARGDADDLTVDNRRYARLPERKKARVLCVTQGNLYLEAALLLDEYLSVSVTRPANYQGAGDYDVVIFDGFVPAELPRTPALYLYPKPQSDRGGPFAILGTLKRPFFDRLQRDHPLLRWTALGDVNVAEALQVQLQAKDQVIGADRQGPLLVAGTRHQNPFVALTFDVRRSDLPLRAAWPLLLLNTVDWFLGESEPHISSWRTGQAGELALDDDVEEVTVLAPDGERQTVSVTNGRAVFTPTRAGLYTLHTPRGRDVVAVNPDAEAPCGVAPRKRLSVAGRSVSPASTPANAGSEQVWVYLLLLALAVLFIEWFTYHRRWTV